jgi:hypothetical protein
MKRMYHHSWAAVLAVIATLVGPIPHAAAQELPANIVASTDAATRADQRLV